MYRNNQPRYGRGQASFGKSYGRGGRGGGGRRPQKRSVFDGIAGFIEASGLHQEERRQESAIFQPTLQFETLPVAEGLKKNIIRKGYKTPTPIQDQAIPHILNNKNLVGIANTGTGKSAAFLIPLIHKVFTDRASKVLIMVPTRELALQLEEELASFTYGSHIHAVICVGGMSIGRQIGDLHRTHQFVIGTPGRLKDLVNRGEIKLSSFNTVVLDEVDRMLDMGFIGDMQYLINMMPENKHSLFFSATLTDAVEKVMRQFVNEYEKVSVKSGESSHNVTQSLIKVGDADKMTKLQEILDHEQAEQIMVFVRTKHGADKLGKQLAKLGYKADSLHGDKRQSQRQRVIGDFKRGRLLVLVATDVAARGLDIPKVSHVVNYDLPATKDDYIHRIGRAGRGDKKGFAVTLA